MFVDNGYKEVDEAWRFVISTEKDSVVLVVFNFKKYINTSDCGTLREPHSCHNHFNYIRQSSRNKCHSSSCNNFLKVQEYSRKISKDTARASV